MLPEEVNCPACTAPHAKKIGRLPDTRQGVGVILDTPLPGGSLYCCSACRLRFRFPILNAEQYRLLYDNGSTTAWDDGSGVAAIRPDWDEVTAYVQAHAPAGAAVLDYGCYTGGLLARLGADYRRFGVEVSSAAAKIAAEHNDAIVAATLDDLPAGQRFDAVIGVDVVEHLPNPDRLLRDLLATVAEGGVLILTTGDAENFWWRLFGSRWWYCASVEHIAFISESWLRGWLAAQGGAVQLENLQRFRYGRLTAGQRLAALLRAIGYGFGGQFYLGLLGSIKKIMGRPPVVGVSCSGLSRDHLLIVLRKK